jgi:hypothetical protein
MNIAVYIGGAFHGLDTPCGGEPRWYMNFAEMMALNGHNIHCYATGPGGGGQMPTWGHQTPIKNITLLHPRQYDQNFIYDVFFSVPLDWNNPDGTWSSCPKVFLKAKKYIHCSFSWNTGLQEVYATRHGCTIQENAHIIALPYQPISQYETDPNGPMVRVMNYPLFNELAPISINKTKGFTWASKDVFSDEWGEDKPFHEHGRYVLEKIAQIAQKDDIPCFFISGETFDSKRAIKFGIPEILSKIPKIKIHHGIIPLSYIKTYFGASRMTIPMPGWFGGCCDAVAMGAMALNYKNSAQCQVTFKTSPSLNVGMSKQEVQDIIEYYYLNDQATVEAIELQRQEMDHYSYTKAYPIYMDVFKELGFNA